MAANPQTPMTPDQHLYAMSGGAYGHSQMVLNAGAKLRSALKGRSSVLTGLRVSVSDDGPHIYPDLVIVSGRPEFLDERLDTLVNPTAIVEVVSASTEAYDRGSKFAQYRTIGSLQEYVLVSQIEARVEVWKRQEDNRWVLRDFIGLDAVCRFDSLDCQIPLAEIYFEVQLSGGQNL